MSFLGVVKHRENWSQKGSLKRQTSITLAASGRTFEILERFITNVFFSDFWLAKNAPSNQTNHKQLSGDVREQSGETEGRPRRVPPFRAGKPPPTPSGMAQISPGPHFFGLSLPFPSLFAFLATFWSSQFRYHFFEVFFIPFPVFHEILDAILASF